MLDFGKLIEEMEEQIFSDELCNTLLEECRAMEVLAPSKKEYLRAKAAFEKLLSAENQALLNDAEKTAFDYCKYAITYTFRAGIYTGFEQMFSLRPMIEPFKTRILDELSTADRMKKHARYYRLKRATLEAFKNLHALLDDKEEIKEHITSVDTAWDEWGEAALRFGFFLGYRCSLLICGKIDPTVKYDAISRILSAEYELGFTSTTEELEEKNRGKSEEDQEELMGKLRALFETVGTVDDETGDDA